MTKISKTALEKLQQQQAKLDARIKLLQARHKVSERKQETRRKILVGAYFLEQARQNNTLPILTDQLASYLTRNSDRRLFDLPDLPEAKSP